MSDEHHDTTDAPHIEQFIRSIPTRGEASFEPGAQEGREHIVHTLLHFTLGERHYAIPGEHIREVIQPDAITRLPGAPPHIRGVVVHRRSVIGVLEIERWLELGDTPSDTSDRLILVEHGDLVAGLCTDSFTRIMTLDDAAMQRAITQRAPNQDQAPYVRAIIEPDQEGAPAILLLHITRLLGDAAIRH